MASTRTLDERITEVQERIAQLENQKKQLIEKQKLAERNARTKRLCSRMGLFESMLPNTIPLTDEQFKIFLEKTVTTEYSRRILDGLTAQSAATPGAETAAQVYPTPGVKPTRESDVGPVQDGGNGAGQGG